MAYGAVISVTTTATLIIGGGTSLGSRVAPGGARGRFLIQNIGSVNVFLGGSTVDDTGGSKGKRLQPGETLSFEFSDRDDGLYGIVASGTCDVDVLRLEP